MTVRSVASARTVIGGRGVPPATTARGARRVASDEMTATTVVREQAARVKAARRARAEGDIGVPAPVPVTAPAGPDRGVTAQGGRAATEAGAAATQAPVGAPPTAAAAGADPVAMEQQGGGADPAGAVLQRRAGAVLPAEEETVAGAVTTGRVARVPPARTADTGGTGIASGTPTRVREVVAPAHAPKAAGPALPAAASAGGQGTAGVGSRLEATGTAETAAGRALAVTAPLAVDRPVAGPAHRVARPAPCGAGSPAAGEGTARGRTAKEDAPRGRIGKEAGPRGNGQAFVVMPHEAESPVPVACVARHPSTARAARGTRTST
jgi:hypothetical protein